MKPILSFARRIGRKLTLEHISLLEKYLPEIGLSDTNFNVSNNFVNYFLEIGFGNGVHIYERALRDPQNCYIGCEPFLNGVTNLLKKIDNSKAISNIYIWPDDVKKLLESIPNEFLSGIYILFPDPWPKKKHLKRRIINNDFLTTLAKKIKKDGNIIIATDHQDYAEWILEKLQKSKDFTIPSVNLSDFSVFPTDWIKTKYQMKAESLNIHSYYFCGQRI